MTDDVKYKWQLSGINNQIPSTMDNEIHNAQNVRTALVNSTIPGVLAMDVNQCVYVLADDWENCLREISELSGTKWNKKRKMVGVPSGSVR